ncbi:hypothetical protein IJ579_02380 [bacterium]|nr:hypothetical protein [bacterium]
MIIKKKNQKQNVDEGIDEQIQTSQESVQSVIPELSKEEDVDLFDLDNIDFKQRQERRKGDRRRGFRRIDDRNLISRAREEANAIREAAAQEGYQEGINAAQEDIQSLKASLESFWGAKQAVYNEIAPEILDISLDIAKKIIKKEMSEDPQILIENIKEILKGLSREETKIMLKVNPSQTDILKQEIPQIVSAEGLEAKVIIIPDENTMEGGCLVTTTNGVIDATIETQLSIISEVLKEV